MGKLQLIVLRLCPGFFNAKWMEPLGLMEKWI